MRTYWDFPVQKFISLKLIDGFSRAEISSPRSIDFITNDTYWKK